MLPTHKRNKAAPGLTPDGSVAPRPQPYDVCVVPGFVIELRSLPSLAFAPPTNCAEHLLQVAVPHLSVEGVNLLRREARFT